ncbi:AraC family transcriptional regulator [Paracoccus saliphilus]|uniref:Helix-turn-helix transcriptional regulator n=1 Tax=Paracoccus saliphilus TaxID=405559 RepID=A0AA46A763_9RHOB|nr:AraC family transcriptional regulator [Paracoccus saliphilus]WCR02749.1 helix-turn-helix transcriptional regulator [Paracoccus saliphilus]SIT08847.1 transcriptional regulator, AraC family [Paracoccus saliphilus]
MTQVKSMSFALQQADLLRVRATVRHFDPHLHSTYSIVALKRGAAEIRSARWSETARAGDVFFFNPYEVHSAYCSEEDAEYEALYPSKEFLIRCLALEPRDGPLNIQTAILKRDSATRELIDALYTPAVEGNSIEASLGRILTACEFSTDSADESPGALARRACMLIRKNCTRAMRTEELAREMGVHKSHLVRAFSKAVGMAPQKYMRQVRVAKARELISEGSQLSEVALMLDFSDQAHFTREFKKVFGVPPGALLRDLRGHRRKKGASHLQVPLSDQAVH